MENIDYSKYTNLSKEELPEFVDLVFQERNISDNEKIRFSNEFLNQYIQDNEYRELCQEKYIFFVYRKMWNIIGYDRYNANIPDDVPGYKILGFFMTDNPYIGYI